MIRRLYRWLVGADAFGYPARDRLIFHYRLGSTEVRADPLAAHRALFTDAELDLALDPKIADHPTAEGLRAQGRIAAAVRRAFRLPAFDPGGPLDAECLNLFVAFGEYVQKLTESARPLSSGPKPTAPPASAGCPTATSAASGSVPTASSPTAAAG